MKRLKGFVSVTVLCLTFLFPTPSLPTTRGIQLATRQGEALYLYKDYYALVVGVGEYTNGWPSLPGALKDSQDVAAALEDYGFTVKLVRNPTSRELKKALTEMAFFTGKEEKRALLLYFAGHGETLNLADGTKLGYIIPADCPLKDKDPIAFDDLAVSMQEMEALALKAKCKHVLMVFDSCFSGSLFNLVRAAPVEISEKSVRPVRQFITAGAEGEQVPDKSVFKQVFLEGIQSDADLNNDGYITASELGMYLQTRVVNYSRGGQHPQYGKINNPKLDKGDFIFVPQASRRKQDAETKKAEAEKSAISEELKRLQEERKKNEELMEKLKQLLDAKLQSEETQRKRSIEEQKSLEEKLKEAERERQISSTEADEKIRRMEAERKAAEERSAREAAERKALEEEVQRLRTESRKSSQAIAEIAAKNVEEPKVASIPKEVAKPEPPKSQEAEPGLKLAIFPMHVTQHEENFRSRVLKAVHIAIDRSDLFKEISSCYGARGRPDIKRIRKDLPTSEIWKRKNIFSNLEPDVEAVCREGKKLGMNAVLAVYLDTTDRTSITPIVYLIDVERKKSYSAKSSFYKNAGEFSNVLMTTTGDVLKSYSKER